MATKNKKEKIKDIDNNLYDLVQIEDQVWSVQNLNVSKYKNGDLIEEVTDLKTWSSMKTGAWCYYNFEKDNEEIYGKLYNWYAVTDPRGIAPDGFHIPTIEEWDILISNLKGDINAGGLLKEKGNRTWEEPNQSATNKSGFSAIASGILYFESGFDEKGTNCNFWTSSDDTKTQLGKSMRLSYLNGKLIKDIKNKLNGLAIRFVKDSSKQINEIILDGLKICTTDIGEYTWDEGMARCKNLGDGWRMPTRDELNFLFNNKTKIGNFTEGFYWSSEKATEIGSNFAWCKSFEDGFENHCSTNFKNKCFVRAIKSN